MINNKKSKILIGCLALLLVLSVGYAYFSQNITINGTATAKGDFNITAACTTGIDSKIGTASDFGENEQGYKNDSCTVSGNAVSINLELEYPGAERYFTIKMTNSGTIDASLNLNEEITYSGKLCGLIGNTEAEVDEAITNNCFDITNDDMHGPSYNAVKITSLFSEVELWAIEKKDGTFLNFVTENFDESELIECFSDTGALILKPGYTAYFLTEGWFQPKLVEDVAGNYFNLKTNLTTTFNWHQLAN